MPQPLSRVMPGAVVYIGNSGDHPIARHPDLAVLALEAIVSWTQVETFLLNMYVQLLGGKESSATIGYLALDSQSAKMKMIREVLRKVMKNKPREKALFEAVLAIASSNEKERNKLAHWSWGDTKGIPDALLLADPRATHKDEGSREFYVYRAQDFVSIAEANHRLCGWSLLLSFIIKGHPGNKNGEITAELEAEPEIEARLLQFKKRNGDGMA